MKHISIYVRKPEQLKKAIEFSPDRIIIEYALYFEPEKYEGAAELIKKADELSEAKVFELAVSLPHILTGSLIKRIRESVRELAKRDILFLCDNFDALGLLSACQIPDERIILDAELYTFSNRSVNYFKNLGYREFTFPYELNAHELGDMDKSGGALIVYGNIPVMYSMQCVMRISQKCTGKASGRGGSYRETFIIDRKKCRLPIICECSYGCDNVIYNSRPLFLLHLVDEIEGLGIERIRLDFTTEDEALIGRVLDALRKVTSTGSVTGKMDSMTGETVAELVEATSAAVKINPRDIVGDFTKGHFKRGV